LKQDKNYQKAIKNQLLGCF